VYNISNIIIIIYELYRILLWTDLFILFDEIFSVTQTKNTVRYVRRIYKSSVPLFLQCVHTIIYKYIFYIYMIPFARTNVLLLLSYRWDIKTSINYYSSLHYNNNNNNSKFQYRTILATVGKVLAYVS